MTTKRTRWLGLVLALATCTALLMPGSALALPPATPKTGMVCTPGMVSGTTHTFYLQTSTGYIQTPDGNSVYMWSYAVAPPDDPNGPTGVWPDFQSPGPVLCVTQGQTVVINLTNNLPEPASIVFPGQDSAVTTSLISGTSSSGLFTLEANPASMVSYSFLAGSPGTYLYESGSDISKQVEMGLYGALVVRPAGAPAQAYGAASTAFDPAREYMLLLSEVDPDLHHALDPAGTGGTYDFTTLHNRYYMVNGRAFPDTLQANGSGLLPSQPYGALVRIQPNPTTSSAPALIRMLNAGTLNHPFHPHGNHTREIAQDGRPILNGTNASTEHFGETIGSGQTLDYLIRWDDQVNGDNWNPVTNPLPVAQPSYLNLVFKDGNTWYSGNPYLGYKGTLPTGTNSLNVCGEWYFPLHSHALNEFANFDEPFGGMATLLRVDPLGGCFTFPSSTKISTTPPGGTLNSGTYANLNFDNETPTTKYYKVNSTTTGGTRTSDWYGQFSGVPAGAANLKVTYNGNNSIAGISTRVWIWNWAGTGSWVQVVGPTTVGTSDVTVANNLAVPAPPPGGFYIGTGANKGFVRVRVQSTGGGTTFVTGGDFMKLVYDAP